MIKQLLFHSFIFLFVLNATHAQKIDLDKKTYTIEYIDLPSNNALSSFENYAVEFLADQAVLDQLGLTTAAINSYFQLEGFSYTTGKSDFTYSIKMDKPQFIEENIPEKKQEIKNPDGSMKVTSKYSAVVKMAMPTTIALINNQNGTILYSSSFSTTAQPTVFQSAEMDTKERAQTLINLKEKGLNTAIRDTYIKTLQAEVNKVKEGYTFRKFTATSLMWEINENKAPELATFNKELTQAISIIEKLSYKEPLTKAKEDMASVQQYWSEHAKAIDATDKNLRKLKYAHLFNLAKSQYYLEEFDECEKTCQLIIDNDYDKSDGKTILDDVKNVKDNLAKSGQTSRHMNRPGFNSQTQFVYTPGVVAPVAKTSFVDQNKQDVKNVKNSVSGIKGDLKKDFGKKVLKDSIDWNNAHFSTVKFVQSNIPVECNEGSLERGWAMPSKDPTKAVYEFFLGKKEGLIPKEGSYIATYIDFYTNYTRSANFDADSLLALLKLYENDKLMDITVNHTDTIPYGSMANHTPSKTIWGKDYNKKLSADISFYYHKSGDQGATIYKTNNGDQFNVKIVEVLPVVVTGGDGTLKSKGYMVRLLIPEVQLTKFIVGHYASYEYEYVTIKNMELRALLMSAK